MCIRDRNMSLLRCVFMYNVCMPVCIERWMDGWIDACIYDMYVCLCRVVRSIHTAACTHSYDVFCFITRLYSSVALKQKACLCANAENIAEDLHQGCTGDLWHTTFHIIYFQYSLCLCFFFSSLRELSSSSTAAGVRKRSSSSSTHTTWCGGIILTLILW